MDWFGMIGTIAFAISGYLVGVRKECDVLGIGILALLTAIGGGMMRDVLMQRTPVVFLESSALWTIAATVALVWILRLHQRESRHVARLIIIVDSIGLVAFSMTGALLGTTQEINAFGVAMLAFVTAVGGGVVRDMMVNEVPDVLHKDFYGTVALLIGFAVYGLDRFALLNALTIQLLFAGGLALRFLAQWRTLELPKAKPKKG